MLQLALFMQKYDCVQIFMQGTKNGGVKRKVESHFRRLRSYDTWSVQTHLGLCAKTLGRSLCLTRCDVDTNMRWCSAGGACSSWLGHDPDLETHTTCTNKPVVFTCGRSRYCNAPILTELMLKIQFNFLSLFNFEIQLQLLLLFDFDILHFSALCLYIVITY